MWLRCHKLSIAVVKWQYNVLICRAILAESRELGRPPLTLDLMGHQRVVHLLELLVAERLAEIDAEDSAPMTR